MEQNRGGGGSWNIDISDNIFFLKGYSEMFCQRRTYAMVDLSEKKNSGIGSDKEAAAYFVTNRSAFS